MARGVIPQAFRGVWSANDICRKDEFDDSKLTITARDLQYYESGGSVISVTVRSARDIVVKAKFSGEDQSWTDKGEFRLSRNGNMLISVFRDRTSFARHRCKL